MDECNTELSQFFIRTYRIIQNRTFMDMLHSDIAGIIDISLTIMELPWIFQVTDSYGHTTIFD